MYSSLKAAAIKLRQDRELTEQEAHTYIRSGQYITSMAVHVPVDLSRMWHVRVQLKIGRAHV